jgi:hypothetical protein
LSRLLIITAWYHPFIHPRAHRWTALAEFWAAQGHDVQVLTARHRDCADLDLINGVRVHRVGFDSLKEFFYFHVGSSQARGRIGNTVGPAAWSTRVVTWLYRSFWKNIYFPDDAGLWYFSARKKALQLLSTRSFDALISVSLPFTGHLVGLAAKRRFPQLCWLADVGDPFSIQDKALNNAFLYRKKSRRFERMVLENADATTVTTAYTARRYTQFFGNSATARVHVIPPLLHPAPSAIRLPEATSTISRIGYFGALYNPVRTPDAFLDLLEYTLIHSPRLRNRLEVHFFGEVFPEFYPQLAAQSAIHLHGLRPRAEVQAAMQQMDVLLNIGNQTDFQLPSKAVDYLAAGKPIINIRYVEDDPFAEFLAGLPWVLDLNVKNGKVEMAGREQWLAWLEGERPAVDEALCHSRMAAYTVSQIAGHYQDLLGF